MTETDVKIRLGKFLEPPTKTDFLNYLNDNLRSIEGGLVLLDVSVPIAGSPPIDILAKDIHGHLTIINFVDGKDASWLPHTINHFDWINKNKYFLSKSFISTKLDHNKPVRVIIILQQLLPAIRNTLNFISGIDISFFQVRGYELEGEKLLLLEPILRKESEPIEVKEVSEIKETVPTVLHTPINLSDEEISDFYN